MILVNVSLQSRLALSMRFRFSGATDQYLRKGVAVIIASVSWRSSSHIPLPASQSDYLSATVNPGLAQLTFFQFGFDRFPFLLPQSLSICLNHLLSASFPDGLQSLPPHVDLLKLGG